MAGNRSVLIPWKLWVISMLGCVICVNSQDPPVPVVISASARCRPFNQNDGNGECLCCPPPAVPAADASLRECEPGTCPNSQGAQMAMMEREEMLQEAMIAMSMTGMQLGTMLVLPRCNDMAVISAASLIPAGQGGTCACCVPDPQDTLISCGTIDGPVDCPPQDNMQMMMTAGQSNGGMAGNGGMGGMGGAGTADAVAAASPGSLNGGSASMLSPLFPPPFPPFPTLAPVPTTSTTELPITGYPHFKLQKFIDVHLKGGMRFTYAHDENACLQGCLLQPYCVAFDWDSSTHSCWHHGPKTGCGKMFSCKKPKKPEQPSPAWPWTPKRTHPTKDPPVCTHTRLFSCPSPVFPAPPPPELLPFPRRFTYNHMFGGVEQPGVPSESKCQDRCRSNSMCIAVDWSRTENKCWMHASKTACKNRRMFKRRVIHYQLRTCPNINSHFRQARYVLVGKRILYGQRTKAKTALECVETCSFRNCWAVDFNFADNSCWHHTFYTACNTPQPCPTCVHYAVTYQKCPLLIKPGYHLPGGRVFRSSRYRPPPQNAAECLANCNSHIPHHGPQGIVHGCVAVDWNEKKRTCWIHDSHEYPCNNVTLVPKPGCTHYLKTQTCLNPPPTSVTPRPMFPDLPVPSNIFTKKGVMVKGGKLIHSGRMDGQSRCLSSCLSMTKCLSADYDYQTSTCYWYSSSCDKPTLNQYSIHFDRRQCIAD